MPAASAREAPLNVAAVHLSARDPSLIPDRSCDEPSETRGGRGNLSLESTFGLAPGVAAWMTVAVGAGHGLGLVSGGWAIPITLAVGALIGISGGQRFFTLPESMMYLGTAVWLGIPASIWICVALFAAGIVLLGHTSFGRSLYAVGGNVDAAKAAGIRTDRVLWVALVSASTLAALGGLMLSGRLASVAASQGNGAIILVALVVSRITGGKAQE